MELTKITFSQIFIISINPHQRDPDIARFEDFIFSKYDKSQRKPQYQP